MNVDESSENKINANHRKCFTKSYSVMGRQNRPLSSRSLSRDNSVVNRNLKKSNSTISQDNGRSKLSEHFKSKSILTQSNAEKKLKRISENTANVSDFETEPKTTEEIPTNHSTDAPIVAPLKVKTMKNVYVSTIDHRENSKSVEDSKNSVFEFGMNFLVISHTICIFMLIYTVGCSVLNEINFKKLFMQEERPTLQLYWYYFIQILEYPIAVILNSLLMLLRNI